MFIRPTGAGTNGGCRCLKDLSGGRSLNHALLVLGPILKQIPDEIERLRGRNEKLERVLIEAERYVMGRTIYKTELGKAIEAARSGE
jgi:hypothetical protein